MAVIRLERSKAALEKVQITGAKSEVQQVAKVIAYVNVPKTRKSTLHRTVMSAGNQRKRSDNERGDHAKYGLRNRTNQSD